ncbi:MAG: multidrug ABC transporter ATPase [Solibacillus sp.]|uniref:multidrug ABC transporter ATPase n=1 Tax=Solibacillus sp. TaxID=1909654 RepID=UPI0033160FC3
MKNNNPKNNSEAAQENPISQAATLAVLAGIITTLGDGLATVAAALAIQETQQAAAENNATNGGPSNNGNSNANLQEIHQQLNYLTKEVKKIKRTLNL